MTSINNSYNFNTGFFIPKTNLKGFSANTIPVFSPANDGYSSNPLLEIFGTKAEIEATAKTNPRIQEILMEYNLPLKVNENELEKLKKGHLQKTRITAAKIYSNLPADMKSEVNLKELQEAAMLHDYGKVLIPDRILNKQGNLNAEEWAIMQQHSELGSELLKDKNLSARTKELIKFHHQDKVGKGYPLANSTYEHRLDSEILSVADKFEALIEKRSYKDALPKAEALALIEKDVHNNKISQEVFNALKKAV